MKYSFDPSHLDLFHKFYRVAWGVLYLPGIFQTLDFNRLVESLDGPDQLKIIGLTENLHQIAFPCHTMMDSRQNRSVSYGLGAN